MPRRILSGKVINDKNNKTILVLVVRRMMHKLYKKMLNRSKKYLVHDENNQCKIGDTVKFIETPAFSKRKRWKVLNTEESNNK